MQQQGQMNRPFAFTPTTVFDPTATLVFLFYTISLGMPTFGTSLKMFQAHHTQQQLGQQPKQDGQGQQQSQQDQSRANSNCASMFYVVSSNPTTELLVKLFEVLPPALRLSFLSMLISLLQWPSQSTFYIASFIVYLFHRAYHGSISLQQQSALELQQHPWLTSVMANPQQFQTTLTFIHC